VVDNWLDAIGLGISILLLVVYPGWLVLRAWRLRRRWRVRFEHSAQAERNAETEPCQAAADAVVDVEDRGLPEWLDADDAQLVRIFEYVEVRGSHRLSRYHLNNSGRPLCTYQGLDWLTYALLLAKASRRGLVEVRRLMAITGPRGLTVDHLCREIDPSCSAADARRCQEISHLRWRSRGANVSAEHEWRLRRRGLIASPSR
jgi:hypothetical protein